MIGRELGYDARHAVLAWRVWRLRNGVLRSWSRPGQWDTATKRANLNPAPGTVYGIWAFRTRRSADARRRGRFGAKITGRVRLTGRIMRHTNGYRAYRAEIVGLVADKRLARRYGVPVLE